MRNEWFTKHTVIFYLVFKVLNDSDFTTKKEQRANIANEIIIFLILNFIQYVQFDVQIVCKDMF